MPLTATVTVRLPIGLLEAIENAAKEEGVTSRHWIVTAASEKLNGNGAPKNATDPEVLEIQREEGKRERKEGKKGHSPNPSLLDLYESNSRAKERTGGECEGGKGKPSNSKRRERIPPSWTPSAEGKYFALDRNLDVEEELQAFHAHHAANGKAWADFDAVWRTWCINAVRFGRGQPIEKADLNSITGNLAYWRSLPETEKKYGRDWGSWDYTSQFLPGNMHPAFPWEITMFKIYKILAKDGRTVTLSKDNPGRIWDTIASWVNTKLVNWDDHFYECLNWIADHAQYPITDTEPLDHPLRARIAR